MDGAGGLACSSGAGVGCAVGAGAVCSESGAGVGVIVGVLAGAGVSTGSEGPEVLTRARLLGPSARNALRKSQANGGS